MARRKGEKGEERKQGKKRGKEENRKGGIEEGTKRGWEEEERGRVLIHFNVIVPQSSIHIYYLEVRKKLCNN